ncbi:hypothetical protein Dimus_013028, partial [Dionaea muscipula]
AVNGPSLIHGASTSSAGGGHFVVQLGLELTFDELMSENTDTAVLTQPATLAQQEQEFRALTNAGLVDETGGIGVNREATAGVAGGAGVAGQHLEEEEGMVQISRHDEPVKVDEQ